MRSLVIIPTYNEALTLPALLSNLLDLPPAWDILVIDDASPDGTGTLADHWHRRHPLRIHVIHRLTDRGFATALRTGFAYAVDCHYDRIYHMDADGSHDPADLLRLAASLDQAAVVVGSRYVPGGQTPQWPWPRRILSRSASLYTRWWLHWPFQDSTSGFKGFQRNALQALLDTPQYATGFSCQIEMLAIVWQQGWPITELPIVFHNRQQGRSKMSRTMLWEALRLVPTLRHRRTVDSLRPVPVRSVHSMPTAKRHP